MQPKARYSTLPRRGGNAGGGTLKSSARRCTNGSKAAGIRLYNLDALDAGVDTPPEEGSTPNSVTLPLADGTATTAPPPFAASACLEELIPASSSGRGSQGGSRTATRQDQGSGGPTGCPIVSAGRRPERGAGWGARCAPDAWAGRSTPHGAPKRAKPGIGAPTASLRPRSWRRNLWDGRPYPPARFSWRAWRSGLASSRPSEPRTQDFSELRGVYPTAILPISEARLQFRVDQDDAEVTDAHGYTADRPSRSVPPRSAELAGGAAPDPEPGRARRPRGLPTGRRPAVSPMIRIPALTEALGACARTIRSYLTTGP